MERGTLIITLVLFALLCGLAAGFWEFYFSDASKKAAQAGGGEREGSPAGGGEGRSA